MTSSEERILHLALEEMLGDRPPPDLSLRILAARRMEVEAAVPARAPRRILEFRPLVAAALVLVALGGGLVWMALRPAPPRPVVATGARALPILVDGRVESVRVLRGGETVVVRGREAVSVSFPACGDVELTPPAVVLVGSPDAAYDVLLRAGRMRVRASGPMRIAATGPGEVFLVDGGSNVDFEALVDPWLEPGDALARLTAPDVVRTLVVENEEGRLTSSDGSYGVGPQEMLVRWADGERESGALPSAATRGELSALLALARTPSSEIAGAGAERARKVKELQRAADDLAAALTRRPETRLWLRPRLHERPRTMERSGVHRRLLQVLFVDDDDRTKRVFESVLATTPEVIDDRRLLILAEAGFEGAVRFLETQLAEERAVRLPSRVFPALFFAVRGDDRGRAVLEGARANVGLLGWARTTWNAAVAGLVFLGESSAWDELVRRLDVEVEAALARGDLPSASHAVLSAAYFHRLLQAPGPVPVADTPYSAQVWRERFADRADTAQEVRDLLDELRVRPR